MGSRRRWGSLLVAGLALLALWLDDLDRCRRLVRGRRRELRCLLLCLALRLLARSISALCHRSNLLLRAGQAAPIMRRRPLPTRYSALTGTDCSILRFAPRQLCRRIVPFYTRVIRCHTSSPPERSASRPKPVATRARRSSNELSTSEAR